VLEYPELGMEAVWKIEVEDFPAFIVVDDKGNDFFATVGPKAIQQTIAPRPGLRAGETADGEMKDVDAGAGETPVGAGEDEA